MKLLSHSLTRFHNSAYEEATREISMLKKDTLVDGRYTHEDFIIEHLRLMKFLLAGLPGQMGPVDHEKCLINPTCPTHITTT